MQYKSKKVPIKKEEIALKNNLSAYTKQDLALEELSPTVTKLQFETKMRSTVYEPERRTVVRMTRFYEISYFTKTGGAFVCDQTYYPIQEGHIRFYRPGQIVYSYEFSHAYTLNVSFTSIPQEALIVNNPYLEKLPTMIPVDDPPKMKRFFDTMCDLYQQHTATSQLNLKAKILELLALLIDQNEKRALAQIETETVDTVNRITEYLKQNYRKNLSIVDISTLVNLHPNYVHRIFKKVHHTTPMTFLTELRLAHAKELLLTTSMSIMEISTQCGFDSPSYFTLVFRKHNRMPPKEFRKIYNSF